MSLLEFSYVLSQYNFDSALSLIRSFDQLGLSTSFAEAYDPLEIKGVQLETLGYISTSHAIGWSYFKNYNTVNIKAQKYLRHNARDLADMKH